MSEPTPRLNLIQRAMQMAALKGQQPFDADGIAAPEAPPADAAPAAGPAVSAPVAPAMPVAAVAAANEAPPRAPAHAVRLNFAKLREARIVTPDNTSTATYNEFRAIKRKLLTMVRDPETKRMTRNLVMITSALPGDGKTFTAMNLAIGLAAERNLDVILVDGDVVRPTVADYFEGARDEGLLELLTGQHRQIDEVLHRCLPNLHVMFAGRHHDASPELLASHRMGEICAALSRRFPESVVIIDAPPVLAASEPGALAAQVHHTVMVVSAQQVTRHQIEEALTQVAACPSLSLLFNKSPEWQKSLPYYDYYNYYARG